jgi:hypothetical protein
MTEEFNRTKNGVMMEPLWMLYLDQDDMPSKGAPSVLKPCSLIDRCAFLFRREWRALTRETRLIAETR